MFKQNKNEKRLENKAMVDHGITTKNENKEQLAWQ